MKLTPDQLDLLIEKYCDLIIDGMSLKDMERLIYELMSESFLSRTEEEIAAEITSVYGEDYYQQLVEEVTN
jgi:hypothetical protein